jgi:hypothetical protein
MASATKQTLDRRAPSDQATGLASGPAGILLHAIDLIAAFVADFEPGRYDDADAASLVGYFSRAERLCAAGKTLAAGRVAESNRPALAGHPSAAHWLAGVTGESMGESVDVLKLGQALESQPGVDEAYRNGDLSRTGAKLVAGAVKVNPGSEGELLKAAERDTLRQLKDRCLQAKARGRSQRDAATAYEAIRKARYCRTWTDSEGAFRLDASLTPDAGATLLSALSAETNRFFDSARRAGAHESDDAYRADALVALMTGRDQAAEPGGDSTEAPHGSEEADGGGNPTQRRRFDPRSTVHLRVDLDALRRGSLGDGEVCEIPGVGPVPVETARELMGDAITQLVITNGVDVTTICHLGRSLPTPLKAAIIERDRVCVVPGCDVSHGLEFDHWAVSFADGGAASLENIARLCAHHHRLRTHKGFQLTGGPGRWRWDPPLKPQDPITGSGRSEKARTGMSNGAPPPSDPSDGSGTRLFTLEE